MGAAFVVICHIMKSLFGYQEMIIDCNEDLLAKLKPVLSQVQDKDALIARLVEDLISVWSQYGASWGAHDKPGTMTHACMSAGESAAEVLERLGVAEDGAYSATLTADYMFISQL